MTRPPPSRLEREVGHLPQLEEWAVVEVTARGRRGQSLNPIHLSDGVPNLVPSFLDGAVAGTCAG